MAICVYEIGYTYIKGGTSIVEMSLWRGSGNRQSANNKNPGELAKHLPIPAVVVDKHALVVALNEPYAIFLGVKAQECMGQPIQEVIYASRMPVVLATGEAELSSPINTMIVRA